MTDFSERLARFQSEQYQALRLAQSHVLSAYSGEYSSTPDLAIELPTGVGKTLIALLIADWALDQGMAVAYLTGTRQLAAQVQEQAVALGPSLPVHRFWGQHYPPAQLLAYHQAQAIGIMNYWVYFNVSPVVNPADLLIFDDAHIAEQPLTALFSLRISRKQSREEYIGVCDLVLARTQAYQSLRAMRDGTAPAFTPPEFLAFNDWSAVADGVEEALESSALTNGGDASFVWPQIRGRLSRCGVLVGPSAIEIRPYHPPTQTVPGYSQARQRIYMSATLGTMGDLQRRLGVKPVSLVPVPPELQKEQTGKRLLLLNPTEDPPFAPGPFEFAVKQSSESSRTAWLCASHAEADVLEDLLAAKELSVFRVRGSDDTPLELWRNAAGAHLITAGRFDGFDFAHDICRFVVIPSVPAASTEFERFIVAYLGDAGFMRHRIGQRVTQALGRANRDENDWAVYLGLDPWFGVALADPTVTASFSPEVREVVRAGLERHQGGWSVAETSAAGFRQGEPDPYQVKEANLRPGRQVRSTLGSESSNAEVEAATTLWLGDFARAASAAREASDVLVVAGEPEHAAFWRYVEAHAHWSSGTPADLGSAEQTLEDVLRTGPRTAWFVRLRRTLDEIRGRSIDPAGHDPLFLAWEEWARESGSRAIDDVNRHRTFLRGTHDQQSAALVVLARLCGASASRPREASAPDCVWTWVTPHRTERRVWEVKAEQVATRVPRSAVNQLLGQLSEEGGRAPRARMFGCLLTPAAEAEEDAARAARDKVALLSHGFVTALYDLMNDRFRDYFGRRGTGTAVERGQAREALEGRLPTPGWLGSLLAPSQGRVMSADTVRGVFPS